MTNAMEKSPLWQRTFAASNDPNVTRLVTSLRGARDRVGHLTSRIAASLPSLTMHDLSHLDGLWTVAGTIADEDFALNPLEGYLFGSAVLLHDAALCFEAYSGGQKAVRETVQWKDAYNRRKTNRGEVNMDTVDFEALRSLHAKRAASLATKLWDAEKDPQYIIDDADVKTQYGPLIGEIASSHHWKHRPSGGAVLGSAATGGVPSPRLDSRPAQGCVPAKSRRRRTHGLVQGTNLSAQDSRDEFHLKGPLGGTEPSRSTDRQG